MASNGCQAAFYGRPGFQVWVGETRPTWGPVPMPEADVERIARRTADLVIERLREAK